MNEINKKTKEQTAIVKQAEINKGLKFVGSQRMHRGHTMFQYNVVTKELAPAVIEVEVVANITEYKTKKKVVTLENCQYFPALNRKNAIKKLNSIGLCVTN